MPVDLPTLRSHCRADSADDSLLTAYLAAAKQACATLANRNIYDDSTAQNAAKVNAVADYETAYNAYTAALAANSTTYAGIQEMIDAANAAAVATFREARKNYTAAVNSIVTNPEIDEAVMLLAAHYYRNRESVAAGQSVSAIEVPMATSSIMSHWRYMDELQ